jgi:hypothetical protein
MICEPITVGIERRGSLNALDFSGEGWLLLPGGDLVADDALTSVALEHTALGVRLVVMRPASYGIELLRDHPSIRHACLRDFPPKAFLASFPAERQAIPLLRMLVEDRRARIRQSVNDLLFPTRAAKARSAA